MARYQSALTPERLCAAARAAAEKAIAEETQAMLEDTGGRIAAFVADPCASAVSYP